MANKPIYSAQAKRDLKKNYNSNVNFGGVNFAVETLKKIVQSLASLARNELISGNLIEGLDPQYRKWTIVQNRYVIYFRRTRQNNLRVIAIRGTKEKPLTPEQILQADK